MYIYAMQKIEDKTDNVYTKYKGELKQKPTITEVIKNKKLINCPIKL